MKKIIIAAFALAVTSSAFAQISKGSLFLGLDLGFGSNKTEYSFTSSSTTTVTNRYESSSWDLGPTAQYFLADNLAVGLGFSIGRGMSRTDYLPSNDWNESVNRNTGFNIFGRKYFTCAETFYTYGELNIGIDRGKGESENFDNSTSTLTRTKSESGTTGAAINIGFAWMATPRVMMHGGFGMLGFNSYKSKYNIQDDGDYQYYKGSEFNFSLRSGNVPFSLGFAYLLNGGGD